ncbi:MAG: hypothetical protein ACXVRM_03000 [Solirubrobacteraceae bacterium]
MRLRLALITMTLTVAATPAVATAPAAPAAPVKLTIPGTGVSCVMTIASVSCQGATSATTFSATLTPDGAVTTCRAPQGASPDCVLFPGASYKNVFLQLPEPLAGPFACIPIGSWLAAKGAVCSVAGSGSGFRITAGQVAKVHQIAPGPHPPCTRAALSAALARAQHRRSLAPSYLSRGWRCVGAYAWADLIAVHGPGTGDDITVVYRAKGRQWRPVSRAAVCETGELPARIYLACTVN